MVKRFLVFFSFLVFGLLSLPQTSNAASVWISGQPSCASGPYSITVNWDVAPDPTWGYFVDISPDSSFGAFWNKQVSGGLRSVSAIGGFGSSQFGESAPSGPIQLNPGTTYYARVWSGTHYPNSSPGVSFNVPVCATPTPAPSQPTISGLPACSSSAYNATISWTGTPNSGYGFYVDVDDDPNFGSFYNKNVGSVFSTAVSNFLGLYPSQNQTLALQPGTTYYTRVFNGQHSTANSFSVPVCATPTPTPVPTQPTCSSVGPTNATVSYNASSHEVYAYGVQNASMVHFPTWSSIDGQDDIVWYQGTNLGNGTWKASIDFSRHKPGRADSGQFYSHVYMNGNGYENVPCGTADFVKSVAVTTATPTPAPSQPTISGLPACSNIAYNATISWTGTPNSGYGFYVDVDDDPNFGSFYNKNVGSVMSTAISGFLGIYPDQNQTLSLVPSVTYYTRVFNGQHSTTNSFNVPICPSPAPVPVSSVSVSFPRGGEALGAGGVYKIFWNSTGLNSSTLLNINLLKNSEILKTIATVSNTGSYLWTVPANLAGSDFKISIVNNHTLAELGRSAGLFSIVPGEIIISRASDTPISANVVIGTRNVPFIKYRVTNTFNKSVDITSMSVASSGGTTATPGDFENIYWRNADTSTLLGTARFATSGSGYNYASISNDDQSCFPGCSPGLITIPPGKFVDIIISADISANAVNNHTSIFTLAGASYLFSNDRLGVIANPGFPISGNKMTIINSSILTPTPVPTQTPTPTPVPTPAVPVLAPPSQPSVSVTCLNGTGNATISWSGTPNTYGFYVDISTDIAFPHPFWNKNVSENTYSVQAPSGFGYYPPDKPLPTLILNPGTYHTRVFNGQHSTATTFNVPNCGGTTSARASFVAVDSSTQGNWKGTYGNEGSVIFNDNSSTPNFTVNPRENSSWTWSSNTLDARAPEKTSSSGRIAATIFAPRTFTVDVVPKDSNSHRMALYFLDWDYKGRAETVEILDLTTRAVLDSRAISNFSGGKYLVYDFSGNIQIRFTLQGGDNAVLSGILFSNGSSVPPPPPPPVGTAPSQPSVTVSCSNGTNYANISWTGTPNTYGFYVDISTDAGFPHPFWNKNVSGGPYSVHSVQAPLGFGYYPSDKPLPTLVLNPGTYYARVFNGQHGPYTSFNVSNCGGTTSGYDFDTVNNEFVLTNKTAMDPFQGKGIWLSNERIKVYRNVHGSNWSPARKYSNLASNNAYTLNPLGGLMPTNVGSGVVYVNDGSNYWSNNPYQPGINEDKFESRVGLGYVKEGVTYKNLETSVTYFVPSYDRSVTSQDQSDPVIIQLVNVRNIGPVRKTFKFFSYHDMVPDGTASFDTTTKSLIITGGTNMFLTSTVDMTNYDSSKSSFLGAGADGNPQTVVSGNLGNSLSSSDDILAGQINITLDPGQSHEFAFIVGAYKNSTEKNGLISKYKNINNVKSILGSTKNFYKTKTDNIPGLSSRTAKLQTQLRILGYSALSTSMFWDPFVDKLTLNQMAIYNETVNARDTAQIALGLLYLDPNVARTGIESYLESAQFSNGQIPYGLNIFADKRLPKSISPDTTPPPGKANWGSDDVGWIAFAACSYVENARDANWWNNTRLQYRDSASASDTVYGHIVKALNYDYTNNINRNGLLNTQDGDWIDHIKGTDTADGESVYSSVLLYNATQKCLPYMNPVDVSLYSQRANNLKLAIENNAYDPASGRYARLVTTNGLKVGSSYDNRVFSDMAMVGLTNNFNAQGVRNTVLAAYRNNQGSGNLVYTPSYTTNEESRLGVYSRPNWFFDNKVWARVCALVTVGLKNQGLNNEAEDNFVKCLPDRWTADKYASLFNYIELYDPRGNTQLYGESYKVADWSLSDAVDDAMIIWSQGQLGNGQLAQANPSSSGTGSWGFAKNVFSNIFSTISSSFGSFKLF